MTRRVCVLGHPIRHSLSPALHNRWIAARGLDARYDAIDPGDADGFRAFVEGRLRTEFVGANVTLPFKTLALALADTASDRARAIGAANLLTVTADGNLRADNTDGPGFRAALTDALGDRPLGRVRIVGAGGAAPAIIWACQKLEASRIEIANRTAEKAIVLASRFDIDAISFEQIADDLEAVDVLVNTTALGLPGSPPFPLDPSTMRPGSLVCDIVPSAHPTPLLLAARASNLTVLDGLPMLVHQAIPSFTAWFGGSPPDAEAAIAFLRGAS